MNKFILNFKIVPVAKILKIKNKQKHKIILYR